MTRYTIGQQVYYGLKPGAENHRHKAEVIGVTQLESGMHYVLRNNETTAFIRPEEQISLNITLAKFTAKYIWSRYIIGNLSTIKLETWIAEAIEAYEGGAR